MAQVAAVARVQSLACELPHATGTAKKKKKVSVNSSRSAKEIEFITIPIKKILA